MDMRRMHQLGKVLIAGVLAGVLCVPAIGQAGAAQTKQAAGAKTAAKSPSASKSMAATEKLPTIRYEKYKLKNGLEVILSEDHRLPLVAVDLWYHVGPANEKPGRPPLPAPGWGGRDALQWHHRFRSHELFRNHAREPAADGALAGIGPHGLAAR